MSDMTHAQSIKRGFCMIRSQATADVLPVIKAGPVRALHVEKGFSTSPGLRKTLGRCGRQGGGKVSQKGRRRRGRWTFLSQALQGRCVGRRRGRGGRGHHLMGALQMEPVKPAQNTRKVASSTDPGARSGAFTTSIMLGTLSTTHTAAGGAGAAPSDWEARRPSESRRALIAYRSKDERDQRSVQRWGP